MECIFAFPLSSKRKMHRPMPALLEAGGGMHSDQREAKLLLPRAVGVSLNKRTFLSTA